MYWYILIWNFLLQIHIPENHIFPLIKVSKKKISDHSTVGFNFYSNLMLVEEI